MPGMRRRDPIMAERARELRKNENPAEARMWSLLRAHRLAGLKFRRQHVLGRYVADFVCLPAKLVIEVDGDAHHEDARIHDERRTEDLERMGYRVIRFWNHYVLQDTDGGAVSTILEALRVSGLPDAVKARLEAERFFLAPSP